MTISVDTLTDDERKLWSRVDALWRLSVARDPAPVRQALHSQYTGWVTGQDQPHDREAAIASVGPSSPRVLSYTLLPIRVSLIDGIVGIVHYKYAAQVDTISGATRRVDGRWTEVYIRENDEWLMITVSGGPDGER